MLANTTLTSMAGSALIASTTQTESSATSVMPASSVQKATLSMLKTLAQNAAAMQTDQRPRSVSETCLLLPTVSGQEARNMPYSGLKMLGAFIVEHTARPTVRGA